MLNSDNLDKTKVQLDRDVVEELMKLKSVGDSYSDVVRRLLDLNSRRKPFEKDNNGGGS